MVVINYFIFTKKNIENGERKKNKKIFNYD